jgi:hypothetical protein
LKVNVTVRGQKRPKKSKKEKKNARSKPKKKASMELGIPFLDLFREEFFVALGQALEWSDEDADEFWRDLELYEQLNARGPKRLAGASRNVGATVSGPFVDRVGLLLDPSLMDQARREAAKFQDELNDTADRVLQKVFSRHRTN